MAGLVVGLILLTAFVLVVGPYLTQLLALAVILLVAAMFFRRGA